MKTKLSLLIALTLAGCISDPDPKPMSEVSKAGMAIGTAVGSIQNALRTRRDSSSIRVSEKIGTEIVLSILASSVRVTLADFNSDQATDVAKLGHLSALKSELTVANAAVELIPLDDRKPTHAQFASLLDSVSRARKLIPVTLPDPTDLSSRWIEFLEKEKAYGLLMKSSMNELVNAAEKFAATGASSASELIPLLGRTVELDSSYLEFVTVKLDAKQMAYDDWANLKARALRMDALTQLFAEELGLAAFSSVNFPPVPLDDVVVGPSPSSGSCTKMSVGDQAGTIGAPISTTASPCATASLPTVRVPVPTP